MAEERYAAGDCAEAVELMRHSLLQLPASADYDHLRHQLVLRMAHTQLRDHAATGSPAPLHDARQMLERYAARHGELFGESTAARSERGDVYELLYLVEQQHRRADARGRHHAVGPGPAAPGLAADPSLRTQGPERDPPAPTVDAVTE